MHSQPFVHLQTHLCMAQQSLLGPNQFALCCQGDGGATVSTVGWDDWSFCLALAELRWGVSAAPSSICLAGFSASVFMKSQVCVGPAGASVCCRSGLWGVHWPDPQGPTPDAHLLGLLVIGEIGRGVERTKAPALCWDCDKWSICSQLLALVSGCLLK